MPGRLKIATVIPPHVNPVSSYNSLLKVYSYIAKNFDAEITVFADKKLPYSFGNFGLKTEYVTSIDNHFGLYKLPFLLGLPRLFYVDLVKKLKGFDVIETSSPEFYGYAIQSFKAAKKYNSRLCLRHSTTFHDFFLFPYTKFIALKFAKKAVDYASRIVFANPQAMKSYEKLGLIGKNSEKAVISGHAVDTGIFRPLKVGKESKTVLISVGALIKVKGHQNAIKALRILIDGGRKNLELWIVGEGKGRKWLVQLARSLNLENYVKFLGAKSHEELAVIYNRADVFVLANLQEITPAASEALACKTPVVVMDCGGADFVIPSSEYGIVTKNGSVEDLAEGISRLLENKQFAAKIAEKGFNRIVENFTIKRVAEKLYSAYTS